MHDRLAAAGTRVRPVQTFDDRTGFDATDPDGNVFRIADHVETERVTAKTPRKGREPATGCWGSKQLMGRAADNGSMDHLEPPRYLDELAHEVIGAAITVHRQLGPGFVESIYEAALVKELGFRGIEHEQQVAIQVRYRDELEGEHRLDLLVGGELVVELKAVERFTSAHVAQILSYLRAGGFRLGLLMNFQAPVLRDGIRRVVCSRQRFASLALRRLGGNSSLRRPQ